MQELFSIADQDAPLIKKRKKGRQCPWLSHEIKTLMNNRDMNRQGVRLVKLEKIEKLVQK